MLCLLSGLSGMSALKFWTLDFPVANVTLTVVFFWF